MPKEDLYLDSHTLGNKLNALISLDELEGNTQIHGHAYVFHRVKDNS